MRNSLQKRLFTVGAAVLVGGLLVTSGVFAFQTSGSAVGALMPQSPKPIGPPVSNLDCAQDCFDDHAAELADADNERDDEHDDADTQYDEDIWNSDQQMEQDMAACDNNHAAGSADHFECQLWAISDQQERDNDAAQRRDDRKNAADDEYDRRSDEADDALTDCLAGCVVA